MLVSLPLQLLRLFFCKSLVFLISLCRRCSMSCSPFFTVLHIDCSIGIAVLLVMLDDTASSATELFAASCRVHT